MIDEQLKRAIIKSGLTAHAIAKATGVAQPGIWHFLNGTRDLRLATAAKLAAYFGMELTEPKLPSTPVRKAATKVADKSTANVSDARGSKMGRKSTATGGVKRRK